MCRCIIQYVQVYYTICASVLYNMCRCIIQYVQVYYSAVQLDNVSFKNCANGHLLSLTAASRVIKFVNNYFSNCMLNCNSTCYNNCRALYFESVSKLIQYNAHNNQSITCSDGHDLKIIILNLIQ